MIVDVKIKNVVEADSGLSTDLCPAELSIEEEICILYSSGIVDRYIIRCFSGLNREEVEDIVNDVFRYVLENSGKLRERKKLKAWVLKIANSFACMYKIRAARAQIYFYGDNFAELLDRACYSEDNVAETQEHKELKGFITDLLSILPPVCRKIMEMRYKEDLLFKEISLTLNMNYNTVRSLHARCIKLLRGLLDERGVTINDFYE